MLLIHNSMLPKFYLLNISLLLFVSSFSIAQNIEADTLKAKSLLKNLPEDPQAQLEVLQEALAIYTRHALKEDIFYIKIQIEHAQVDKSIEEALAAREELLKAIQRELPRGHHLEALAYRLVGKAHNNNANFSMALNYFKTADSIYSALDPIPLEQHFNTLIDLVFTYRRIGDMQRYKGYLEIAEQYANKIQSSLKPKIQVALYKALFYVEEPQALELADQAIRWSKEEYGALDPETFQAIALKGHIYYAQRASAKAVDQLKKLLALQVDYYGGEENLRVAETYLNIGAFYKDWYAPKHLTKAEWLKERGQYDDLSIEYQLKAAGIYERINDGRGMAASHLYRNLGYSYFYKKGNWQAAVQCFHKSLLAVLPNETEQDAMKVIPFDGESTLCLDLVLAFRAQEGKLHIMDYMYRRDSMLEVLPLMEQTLKIMEDIATAYSRNLADDAQSNAFEVRRMTLSASIVLYDRAIELDPNAAFDELSLVHRHLELNKNSMLLSNLQTDEASAAGLLNSAFVEEESTLKKEIDKHKKQLLELMRKQDSTAILDQKKKLLKAQSDYEVFIDKIEKEDPQYFELKYHQQIPNLKAIQELLDEETVIIEYFKDKSKMMILQIAKDTAFYRKIRYGDRRIKEETISRGDLFQQHFQGLRASLTDIARLKSDSKQLFQDFCTHSHGLYQMLEIDSFLHRKDIKHLIIIPTERLNYIPFEVLLRKAVQTDSINYRNLPYLFKDFKISYAYSTSLLYQNLKQQVNGGGRILAFAASYEDGQNNAATRSGNLQQLRSSLSDLPGAKAEVQALQGLYVGQFLLGDAANEANFKTWTKKRPHAIVHLAMHGLLNQDYPFASSLAFTENGDSTEDNFVFAHELTQMQIQANLVVLSACETGYGKFEYGEGVASLARSFMFAGTPAMLMTLWEVNDYSTSKIMGYFYEFLYQGMDKAEALQQAKLKYLEEASDKVTHPFFWAPFVQLGNYEPLKLRKKSDDYWFWGMLAGGGVLLLLLAGGWYYRQSKQKVA